MARYSLFLENEAVPKGDSIEVPPFGLVENFGDGVVVEIVVDDVARFEASAHIRLEPASETAGINDPHGKASSLQTSRSMRVEAINEMLASAPDEEAAKAAAEAAKKSAADKTEAARERDRVRSEEIRAGQAPEGGDEG